jgi:hypothetical protein
MQLNTDLTQILTDLGKIIPKDIVTEQLKSSSSILIYVKTPNIFYKKYYLYHVTDEGNKDITGNLSEDDIKEVRNNMGQAYFNYFTHYNEQYPSKFYSIKFERKEGSTKLIPIEAIKVDTLRAL